MIEAIGEFRVGRPTQRKVLFKDVIFQRRSRVQIGRVTA